MTDQTSAAAEKASVGHLRRIIGLALAEPTEPLVASFADPRVLLDRLAAIEGVGVGDARRLLDIVLDQDSPRSLLESVYRCALEMDGQDEAQRAACELLELAAVAATLARHGADIGDGSTAARMGAIGRCGIVLGHGVLADVFLAATRIVGSGPKPGTASGLGDVPANPGGESYPGESAA